MVCFLGGNLALAAKYGLQPKMFLNLAKRVTETCVEFYKRMETGLSPEIVHFSTHPLTSRDKEIFVKVGGNYLFIYLFIYYRAVMRKINE